MRLDQLLLTFYMVYLALSMPQFNMYFTEKSGNTGHVQSDCLYYRVLTDIHDDYEFNGEMKLEYNLLKLNHQFISYCIRPSNTMNDYSYVSKINGRKVFFSELQEKNISSKQLYMWSVPIDIIEQYVFYSRKNETTMEDKFLYNCTSPYFGSKCQYSFLMNTTDTFSDIVKFAIRTKNNDDRAKKLTCFVHLNCIRGPPGICLDWREICDGQLDCLDGEDEDECFNLEISECEENEYRCQNGQCIPRTFFHDNPFNPDCLDRTDEPSETMLYPSGCSIDPSFRCEDSQCRPGTKTPSVCGDGQCTEIMGYCANHRNSLFLLSIISGTNVSGECFRAMRCLMKLGLSMNNEFSCHQDCSPESCLELIQDGCPNLFPFPAFPILFGHIRFVYDKDKLNYNRKSRVLFPNYVCYDRELCGFLFSTTVLNTEQLACSLISDAFDETVDTIFELYTITFILFRACSYSRNPIIRTETYCQNPSFYRCANTSKCISKRRLLDGVHDCYHNDDEYYPFSCSLADKNQRFSCSDDITKCLSLHRLHNGVKDCMNDEDEMDLLVADSAKKVAFQTVCDGFTELKPIAVDNQNETDETECEYWPCDNIYTRCDGIWNCENGSDEINCTCDGQWCVSFKTREPICLSAESVNDGVIDCVGGSDERQYCRSIEATNPDARFLCNPPDSCISINSLCNTINDCMYGDDEKYCKHYTLFPRIKGSGLCVSTTPVYNLTRTEKLLCQLTEVSKRKMVYFSLNNRMLSMNSSMTQAKRIKQNIIDHNGEIEKRLQRCHRGLPIFLKYFNNTNHSKCLCPQAYYGDQCQFQNERTSLTLKLRTAPSDWRSIFAIVIMLIDNEYGLIESSDQLVYNHFEDCQVKFDVNLLYSTQPKNNSKTYSIRIDVFDKYKLAYRSSWIFPVRFPFLPVYRLATELNIPLSNTNHYCLFNCSKHGQCIYYENEKVQDFCLCDNGWTGLQCSEQVQFDCAPDAKFISSSLCLCKAYHFGTRCFLTDTRCEPNMCHNGGICHSPFPHDSFSNTFCICSQGYSGQFCEILDTEVIVRFSNIITPAHILVHFIETSPSANHLRTTTFKRQTIGQKNIIFSTSINFHLMFVEFERSYYFVFATNTTQIRRKSTLETEVSHSKQCLSLSELNDNTFAKKHLLKRIKYYHLICKNHTSLSCFYDDVHLCLCASNQHANCFEFNHNMSYDCQGFRYCGSSAKCFQNNPNCPTSSMCVCDECYYGSRCQFSTIGFALSLDGILGYQVVPSKSFIRQTLAVKISATISTILFVLGFISGIFSIITFRRKKSREVGCGYYLLSSSVCLIITITLLQHKFWFLVLSQMLMTKNHSILLINCTTIDYLIRSFLSSGDWLNACVAIERAVSAVRGVQFNRIKSIQIAKRILLLIMILCFVSHLQDPFHRQLMYEEEDNRIWCITQYSSTFSILNSGITIFHFFTPFMINVLSIVLIITRIARRRRDNEKMQVECTQKHMEIGTQLTIKKEGLYKQHIYQQIQKHKHILISSFILILTALPRLIISFLSGCMKSQRDPWLFLIGYFASFVPPVAHFIVFVLPSKAYKGEFLQGILHIRRRLHLI